VFPLPISISIVVGGIVGFQAGLPPFAMPLALAIGWLGIWMTRTSVVASLAPSSAPA
jgi:hypothetical protein